ncbi:ABC transporter substrate-binding protein [Lentzea sp. BCCO 10_0798]|uniref:ABC transporter substrate-binding protein n=1 Tax=Lentzea kristufekii TaxID=3095430 RepID=A0ABU4U3K5_9PSEU|nr:ABC transporter substrate-binding protein [Lentzea sp. BCCO 10_0798]MDX8055091.1 ABC transporter substrate-binding protein [Lentzea sp. BCCO 10_0798]
MRTRRALLVTALAAVCGLTAGCFTGAASQEPQRLRVALPFPPYQALSPWGNDGVLLTRLGIAETLVGLDRSGRAEPMLAESWTRQSDTQWRFHLRHSVKFHDGAPLTARSAADSLNRAAQASPVPRAIMGVNLVANAEGDLDLTVTTAKADPTLPQRMSSPNLVVLAPSAYTGNSANPRNAGTGPFVLQELKGDQSAALGAFSEHWAGAPLLSGVDVRFIPDGQTRTAALRAGEVDVAASLPVSTAENLQRIDVPLPRVVSLSLNTAKGVFSDPALRGVARSAVDQDALAGGVYESHADAARGLFGPATPWAKAPAPLPLADRAANGEKVVLAAISDRPELPEVASVVAEAWRRKGFQVEQVVRQYSQLEADLLAGRFDAVILSRSYVLDSGDPAGYLDTDFSCAGGFNLSKLCSSEVDAAIAKAIAAQDAPAREQATLDAQAAVLATSAVVPLVHERAFIGHSGQVNEISVDPYERRLVTRSTTRG